ncbi:MAG: isochorismatase family protein [Armatimonadetes bacterium]|nr:isochorismatase family protein [Armatimonadota bacterium]
MISRLTKENCLLLIVDVQTRLLPEMWEAQRVERNCAILAQVVRRLEIPVVVSEQNPAKIGGTIDSIKESLGEFSPVEKMRFSAWPDAQPQIEAANRKTILLCGLEGHICVTQTALDLSEAGYAVFAVYDAISSRQEHNRRIGWERIRIAGALPTSTESAVFELLETADCPDFKAILALIK